MNKLMLCAMVVMACMPNEAALAHGYGHHGMDDCDHAGKHPMTCMGRHSMEGTVESVDHKTGWVKVKTGDGSMTVHFPPDSIKDLKEGEMIDVHLGYSKAEKKAQ